GQKAADRSLELFLGHDLDVRVLTLPENLDPCDFLVQSGPEAFGALVDRAVDPLAFAIARASARFDLDSLEDSRRAAAGVLSTVARMPPGQGAGLDVKAAKALATLEQNLRAPVGSLDRRLRELRRAAARKTGARTHAPAAAAPPAAPGGAEVESA